MIEESDRTPSRIRGHIQDNPLADDLEHILAYTEGLWEDLRGKRIFITGGTGFFGAWLLESFACVNDKLDLKASALVLTRNYDEFQRKAPHLAANPAIKFHIGDVRNFNFPEGEFSHIIHAAATSAVATFNSIDPQITFDIIVEGTKHILDFAVHCHAKKFLLTSSGTVYGKQSSGMSHVSEEYCGAPDTTDPNSFLGESKRAAECLCTLYSKKYCIEVKIARCFSFVGPYLPLDIHYAIGNFIRDGLNGGPICVNGDGTPYRSYLYAADLTIWLWTILFKASPFRAYNVGSEEDITIAELAQIVAKSFDKSIEVKISGSPGPYSPTDRYVPSTKLAQNDLGIRQVIDLVTAIERTITFVNYNKSLQHLKTP